MTRPIFALFLLLWLGLPVAEAKWFRKEKAAPDAAEQLETFQPPPPDAIERYCEPIRKEVVLLNSRSRVERILLHPRIVMLKREHEKCKADLMKQQLEYLRHVDIRQPPSLPKMSPEPSPAAQTPGVPTEPKPGTAP